MSKIETTWRLLFDGPQGFRLVVEYHSDTRPADHEATHKKLVEAARKLLSLRPEFLDRVDRVGPATDTCGLTSLPPIPETEKVEQ